MPPLFENLDSIEKLLSLAPIGLITDIDGTISRLTPYPAKAQVSPICRQYLALLSKHLKLVAVISGRPAAKVRDMIDLEGIVFIGNHGFERWTEGKAQLNNNASQYPALIEAILQDVKALLDIEGIIFENKGVTASIHYRRCSDQDNVRKQVFDALASSPNAKGLIVREGRKAAEILPPLEVNKGSATRDLIREHQLRTAIYMGDDFTDVDAFKAIHDSRSPDFDGICLAVIDKETAPEVKEGADFTLDGVDEVERFLEWMAQTIQA